MVDVNKLFFNDSINDDDPANGFDITSQIHGITHHTRLTNSSCIIIDFDKHKVLYRTKRLLYVDEASNEDWQRKSENPYWALVSEPVLAHLLRLRNNYPQIGKEIDWADYSTHVCITDYPIIFHKKEMFVNQKFTPMVMRQDGITKVGLFIISPSTKKHIESIIITDSGKRMRFDFEKGEYHIFHFTSTLSPIEKAILQRVQKGMTIVEIANDLSLSVSTIKTHRMRIFKKLHVKTMSEAITVAVNYQLI